MGGYYRMGFWNFYRLCCIIYIFFFDILYVIRFIYLFGNNLNKELECCGLLI